MIQTVKKDKDIITNTFNNVYVMTKKDGTISYVPKVDDNTDYQNILEWVAEGNTIEEAD